MHDIGHVYRVQRHFDQALAYYEKAREYENHDLVPTLDAIGDMHTRLGKHENAIVFYKEAIETLDNGST